MRTFRIMTAALLAVASAAHAQDKSQNFPSKPIRIIVGFTPGTMLDTIARTVGQKMTESWGQQVVVDNRDGAGGSISAGIAARAAPDGYTLYVIGPSFLVNPALASVDYEPFRDFVPVSLVAVVSNVLVVSQQFPARSVKELIAYAKAQPAPLHFASAGRGTTSSLTGELFRVMAGIEMTDVPYKSSTQALTDVISGQVAMNFPSLAPALPLIRGGRLRALGVSSAKRAAAAPEIPPIADAVPGFDTATWYGFTMPAKTPPDIVAKLNREIVRILHAPKTRDKFVGLGADVVGSSQADFMALWRSEQKRWVSLLQGHGIQVK